jgi:3-methyladenine DNA glycosylase AlkD
MTPADYHAHAKRLFLQRADPQQATSQAAYMRHQFQFIGLKTPERVELTRQIVAELGLPEGEALHALLRRCAEDEYRELNYFALDLAEKAIKKQPEDFIEQLEALLLTKPWWDTVDWLAKLVGIHFRRYPALIRPVTERWMVSGELWLQRACLIFQLHYKTQTDEELLFSYILRLQHSGDFFIQKGAGWALRQYSRIAPEAVRVFLAANPALPALTRREGGRLLKG